MSYGVDQLDPYLRAASYADRVLTLDWTNSRNYSERSIFRLIAASGLTCRLFRRRIDIDSFRVPNFQHSIRQSDLLWIAFDHLADMPCFFVIKSMI